MKKHHKLHRHELTHLLSKSISTAAYVFDLCQADACICNDRQPLLRTQPRRRERESNVCMSVSTGGTARATEFNQVMGSRKRGRKLRTSKHKGIVLSRGRDREKMMVITAESIQDTNTKRESLSIIITAFYQTEPHNL